MHAFNERRQMRGQGGFTLIELLVVIAILGILAGVVVFAVGGVTDTADNKACQIEGKSVESAAQAFKADSATNALPADATFAADLVTGGYLKGPESKLTAHWTMAAGEVTGIGDCDFWDGSTPEKTVD